MLELKLSNVSKRANGDNLEPWWSSSEQIYVWDRRSEYKF